MKSIEGRFLISIIILVLLFFSVNLLAASRSKGRLAKQIFSIRKSSVETYTLKNDQASKRLLESQNEYPDSRKFKGQGYKDFGYDHFRSSRRSN